MKHFYLLSITFIVICHSFKGLITRTSISRSFLTVSSTYQPPTRTGTRSAGRDFTPSSQDSKPYSKTSSDKPFRRDDGGNGFRGRLGSGGSGSGRSSPNRRPVADYLQKLRFSTTVKIDPELLTSVDEMKLSPATTKVLKDKGFTQMTPVQSQSYDYVYSGGDVVARSRTGTGKTLAFGIPIIEKLVSERKNLMRGGESLPLVLILEPTRELALQVAQELGILAAAHGMKVTAIYGGVSMFNQERDLRNGVHIVVATPGRALDHIGRGTMDLGNVEHVVLDEGDTMLEMGFQADVESIIANVKTPGIEAIASVKRALAGHDNSFDDRFEEDEDDQDLKSTLSSFVDPSKARDVQVLLYSATMPGWICQLTDKHMRTPVFLDAVQEGETRLSNTIKHFAIRLPKTQDRIRSISSSVEDLILTHGAGGQTIVFTNTKDEADSIVASDSFGQLRAQVLHGDISQHGRQVTIKQFKEGAIDVLVATDVAARGLDIAGVDLVVHVGPPNDHDTYVHRSGRTGRAGRNGTSVMLYTFAGDTRRLEDFERQLNFQFEKTGPPSPTEVARASAWYAAKKLEKVDQAAVNYFLPHAKNIVQSVLAEGNDEFVLPSTPVFGNLDEEQHSSTDYSAEKVSQLVARCLAALSNKQTIQTRSLMTGELGKFTLMINAVFKNGTSPVSVRDWQRVFLGVVKRVMNIDDVTIGRSAMARNSKTRLFSGLIDVDSSQATKILKAIADNNGLIPGGIEITTCESLPEIVEDNSFRGGDRDGGRSSYRGGFDRDGGRPSFNRDRDSGVGGGRPYGRDRDSGGSNSYRGRQERTYSR